MDFLQPATAHAFALYAAAAGGFTMLGLARDSWAGPWQPAGRDAWLAPLGLAALAASFGTGAPHTLRLLAGALLLTGLAILALSSRRADRPSPGRQVGVSFAWAAIVTSLVSALFLAPAASDMAT